MSSNYKQAKKEFKALKRDPRALPLDYIVEYKHMDGTCACLHHAYCVELAGDWVAIFTEHNGSHLLNKGDLEYVRTVFMEYVYQSEEV